MRKPKIDWPSQDETDLILDRIGMTRAQAGRAIEEAITEAERLVVLGLSHLNPILDRDRKTWEDRFNGQAILVRWFGRVTRPNHVKDVQRRLDGVCDRVIDKVLTVKVRDELPRDYTAQNNGSFLSPKTFKVASDWFALTPTVGGAVIVHELLHEWFKDQRLDDGTVVYGADEARRLARQNAGKARRSPENYQRFLLDADFERKLAIKEASGSSKVITRR